MCRTYGKRQADLVKSFTFTKEETKKILALIKNHEPVSRIARILKRPIDEIKSHIFVTPSLRIASRTRKDDTRHAERAAIAWAVQDSFWRPVKPNFGEIHESN